jgi:branched-subunit amino acid transport protein
MDNADIWLTIIALGLGTFLIRFSFLGLLGGKDLPDWLTRHLRYVPVAVLPGLVAPLVVWPAATGGEADLARSLAALTALAIGAFTRSVLGAIFGGMAVLYGVQFLLG